MSNIFRSLTPAAISALGAPPRTFRTAGRIGWAGLNGLLEVLGKSTGVCTPLNEIVEGLVELIDVYEVGPSLKMLPFLANYCAYGLEEGKRWKRRIPDTPKRARRFVR